MTRFKELQRIRLAIQHKNKYFFHCYLNSELFLRYAKDPHPFDMLSHNLKQSLDQIA